jgi:ABC-type lipoprotein export system ATPase subunit
MPDPQIESAGVSERSLVVRDLRFRHRSGGLAGDQKTFLLEVPSFSVGRGEHVLLTGASGSGKSTLLQIIAGLLDPERGSVQLGGTTVHDQRGAARDRLRGSEIGMIFQTFHLALGFTAFENVALALLFGQPSKERVPEPHVERARSLLAALALDEIDRPVETLSVGQQQRVAVARALACRPAIVLADEPTASLDPDNALAVVDLIASTCRSQGAALLCASHDRTLVPRFDRHVELASILTGGGA